MKSECLSAVRIPLVAAFALAAFSAQAADMYVPVSGMKDVPEVLPLWSGFFVAGGGGGGAFKGDVSVPAVPVGINGLGGMGGFGTVQAGYDLQIAQRFVGGAFFDYDFAAIGSRITGAATALGIPLLPNTMHLNLTGSWTAGGRFGYLVNPSTLVYGLGGYTEAYFSYTEGTLANSTFAGWTAGGGIETNLGGSWFLKGEYRFTELDRRTIVSAVAGNNIQVTFQPDVQTGRLALSYKLNPFGSGPLEF